MKLAVVLPSLTGGGMERMRLNLIREWLRAGVMVDLVVARASGELLAEVPRSVHVIEVAGRGPLHFLRGFQRYLREECPTHVLVAGYDIAGLVLLAIAGRKAGAPAVVVSVHSNPSAEARSGSWRQRLKLYASFGLIRLMLSRCRGIVAVSEGVANDLATTFGFPRAKVHVIGNPVLTDEFDACAAAPLNDPPFAPDRPWILFAGRFEYQKGLDVLLAAFRIVAQHSNADLVLLGEGSLREVLVGDVCRFGLVERVHFRSFQQNPLPYIRDSNIVVLPSRYEGFGNVLIEALGCGTQVVATDCPSGPAEILDNGRYGQLVPVGDADALAAALLESLTGHFSLDPKQLQARAKRFTAASAAGKYLHVLTAMSKLNAAESES